MSAIGLSAPRGKGFHVSAFAEYRHDHLVFARQQSHQLRELDWEGRVRPLMSWSDIIVRCAGALGLGLTMLAILI